MMHNELFIKARLQQCPCMYCHLPVAATQCAQPAAAFTMETSGGRAKASGVSLNKQKIKIVLLVPKTYKINRHVQNEVEVFYGAALPHASRM